MSAKRDPGLAGRFASRIGRHMMVYAGAALGVLLLGLATTAVQVKFLSRSDYGRVGLVLVYGSLLVVSLNAGTLQGALGSAFSDQHGESSSDDRVARSKARILGTGLAVTIGLGIVFTAISVAESGVIAHALGLRQNEGDLVGLIAAAAGFTAIARYGQNIFRYGRRPVVFGALSLVRPAAVLVTSWLLLADGRGISGVIYAYFGASIAAAIVSLGVGARQLSLRAELRFVRLIARNGGGLVPVVLSVFVMQQGTLYLVYLFGTVNDVADYRLASTVATLAGYAIGSFNAAWGPLLRSPLYRATEDAAPAGEVRARFLTWYVALSMWLLVVMSALGGVLTTIAPNSYARAGDLVPLVSAGYVAWGLFQLTYRIATGPRRRMWFIWGAVIGALVTVGMCAVLIPVTGAWGAGISTTCGFLCAAGLNVITTQRGSEALPLSAQAATVAAIAGAACTVAARAVAHLALGIAIAGGILVIVGYPLLVLAGRGIPAGEARRFVAAMRGAVVPPRSNSFDSRFSALDGSDQSFLRSIAGGAHPVDDSERARLGRLASYLTADRDDPASERESDVRIGVYLAGPLSLPMRDQVGEDLMRSGVPAVRLDAMMEGLRHLPRAQTSPADPPVQVVDGPV